jgi:hypothetical protein
MWLGHQRTLKLLQPFGLRTISNAPQQKEQKKTTPPALVSAKKKPIMLVSEYGELLNIKPMTKPKTEIQYREV